MSGYTYSELAHAAWKMLKAGGTQQEALTYAEDLASRGVTDDAEYWRRVADTMSHFLPDLSKEPCLICGHPAEETTRVENGARQYCADCGLFEVAEPLLTHWRKNPEHYRRYYMSLDQYIEDCAERGEPVKLNDISMAMIKREDRHL